ncbi:50S ribosomal protein L4, bacterial/organelle [Jonquetella anthropi DSM 22815]|uniref:Large ribosomal subunit protein uL4 n=1 Tax=Jonquetella anthropi DSM 22815 TaxID=885272 RepID=H0ULA3_9BACT|nr:50S ribosomal protein L4 [Jonquetella anthropi]EEX48024.1 50S ribosomal protein L4 [Jonquetella anthropi E3_33 E1]EHM13462.1 50S ribosomal protein L4, bacterial/organelle [Jonquetella anthropi DSM 22815]
MPVIKILNFAGEVVGDLELSDAVFGVPFHSSAIHQVVVAQQANARQGTACAKDRGEVRGGGRKPWRQKHTGRARAGSIRSPLWAGGGVVHGPKPRDYFLKVNKKVRALAMRSALSVRAGESRLFAVEGFSLEAPSTKKMLSFLAAVGARKPLIVLDSRNENVIRSAANIQGVKVLHMDSINVLDLVRHDGLVATTAVLKRLEEVYAR